MLVAFGTAACVRRTAPVDGQSGPNMDLGVGVGGHGEQEAAAAETATTPSRNPVIRINDVKSSGKI